jgi:hypothetical protein
MKIKVNFDNSLYKSNCASLKRYNNEMYKLIYFKTPIRQKGFETYRKRAKCSVNNDKLDNNISRAKSKVLEYALCNDFDYFVTLTINGSKYDRTNLKTYYSDFRAFIKSYNRKYDVKIEYIFIPELHSDDVSWHIHGLLKGLRSEALKKFSLEDNIPFNIKKMIEKGEVVYNWVDYAKMFGFNTLTKVKNLEKVSRYITKYINKDMAKSVKELNAHMYYCSKGLKKAVEIKRGKLWSDSIPYDFENDYVKIKWLKNDEIISSIEE